MDVLEPVSRYRLFKLPGQLETLCEDYGQVWKLCFQPLSYPSNRCLILSRRPILPTAALSCQPPVLFKLPGQLESLCEDYGQVIKSPLSVP